MASYPNGVTKLGRNDPCHCGSGNKYKKCCADKDDTERAAQLAAQRAALDAAAAQAAADATAAGTKPAATAIKPPREVQRPKQPPPGGAKLGRTRAI